MAAIDGKTNTTGGHGNGHDDTSLHPGADNPSVPPHAPRLGPVKDPCLEVVTFWLDAEGLKRKREALE